MQTILYDSPGTLVFRCQIFRRYSNGVTLNGGDKKRSGRFKQWFSISISLYLRNGARYDMIFTCAQKLMRWLA